MPPKPKKPKKPELAMLEALAMASALAVQELWSRMMREALGQYNALVRQGLPVEKIAESVSDFLASLSTKPEELLAREVSTVAYSEGRAAELVLSKSTGAATFALRSEVLDAATCEVCATLDGTVVEIGTKDFYELKPPARCRGGERCRGFYIAVGAQIERSAA